MYLSKEAHIAKCVDIMTTKLFGFLERGKSRFRRPGKLEDHEQTDDSSKSVDANENTDPEEQ